MPLLNFKQGIGLTIFAFLKGYTHLKVCGWIGARLKLGKLIFLIEVSLIYNIMLVSNIQHSDSTITHIIKSSPPLVQLLSVNIGRCSESLAIFSVLYDHPCDQVTINSFCAPLSPLPDPPTPPP